MINMCIQDGEHLWLIKKSKSGTWVVVMMDDAIQLTMPLKTYLLARGIDI